MAPIDPDRSRRHDQIVQPEYRRTSLAHYSHGVEAPANRASVHISGQVGVKPDGSLAEGAEAQIEQAWRNIFAILEAAGMTKRDLVMVTAYLARDAPDVDLSRRVRDPMLEGAARRTP